MKEALEEQLINLQTLLHSIPHVQTFKSKWSLISIKLTTLHSNLSHLSSSAAAAANPLSSDLLHSLSATCTSAATLAAVCRSPTPSPGKLKTQNDIDNISAMLDSHINDFQVLLNSGAFDTDAVVSSPEIVSLTRRESVRAEARNLMTRIQIGSTQSKNSALDSVLGLLQEDDKNVLIAVAQGIVPLLVRLLDSTSCSEIKEKTVTAIATISIIDSTKHVLIAEGLGLLNNLIRVLESGSVFAKEKSCIALKALSNSKENARAIGSRGGISSLLEVCIEGTPNSQALAAGVLRNLALFEEIKENFIEENAVTTLLALCDSGTSLAQEHSFACLSTLVSGDDDLKLFVAREGVVESLNNFWNSANTNAQSLEVVVQMVRTLASCPNIAEFLVANGVLNRIVGVLNCGVLAVRITAAKAIYSLAYNTNTSKELGEMGCVSILVRMLDGKAIEEKEAALKTLSMLMNYDGNRKILRKDEKGIVCLVKLLDPLLHNLDKKYVVSILAVFVDSKKCRKIMVEGGACGYLEKLVEKDVDGAKKVLDCLGHGKLWGVFGRR